MRALAAVLLLAAATSAPASLGRLADAAASEILRVAAGRKVELAPPEDRTGAASLGPDLHQLLRARLEGRLAASASGDRVTVTAVLDQVGRRLVWSARIVQEPAGTLADVVSVSTTWDAGDLPLVPARAPAEGVDVTARALTPPVDGRVVALAFAGEDRLLVLFDDALALYRRDGLSLRQESRRELPGPLSPVRFPGGVLLALESEAACWAITSRAPRASLFSLDGGRLTATQQADAMPWPRAPAGVRFRPGTNLLEVALPGLEGPLLALEADEGWAVQADGVLARAGGTDAPPTATRAGPAITKVWPGLMATASADPPGQHDRIVLLTGAGLLPAGTISVDGPVRALAAHRRGEGAVLAAAIEDPAGGFRLGLFELGERR